MKTTSLIPLLAAGPAKINALVAPLTEEQVRWRPGPGEWSIKEVLCHLRDGEEVRLGRMRRVAAEDNPFLPGFDQEAYARDRRYQEELTPTILPAYVQHRLAQLELLRGLPPEAWSHPGVHEESGPLTLRDLAQGAVNHDLEHLEHLRRLRAVAVGAVT